jgi:endonuclease YncB( thermonuclease family)
MNQVADTITSADIIELLSDQKLLSLDIKRFSEFDLNGTKCVCRVLRVYDTDTMTIGFKLSSKFYKKNIRWGDIDAPELHSKVPAESKLCRLGREYIKSKYQDRLVVVDMGVCDKYGRVLASVYDKDTNQNINQQLIDLKFVRTYNDNLHKTPWTDVELQAGIAVAGGLGLIDPGK